MWPFELIVAAVADVTGVFMLPDKIDVPDDLLVYLALSLDLCVISIMSRNWGSHFIVNEPSNEEIKKIRNNYLSDEYA